MSPKSSLSFVLLLWIATPNFARGQQFQVHEINAESTYPACAVFDVNRDGRMDIFCGGWWYEAPKWERHFVRDVEVIRDRYDDYSNLPFDVNDDGWLDIISCNYRSQSLFWVRHPGENVANSPWEKVPIETPGAMETGRLVDVDGDGDVDVLPNGTEIAFWYELSSNNSNMLWTRHELPQGLAGHGIGAGDINGDGRMDLVNGSGWWEGSAEGNWVEHRDFRLHRDASVPILVHDVDDDGDADLIWGRGHHVGLYWLEQTSDDQQQRAWQWHAIDTSWSQAHSLLLADLDGDGSQELVAGKRYMGHEGKDIGEYDPLAIYWYRFSKEHRAWEKGIVATHPRIGFGLDPKAADVDGDGDLDIVAADRSSLGWCENLGTGVLTGLRHLQGRFSKDHAQLMTFVDDLDLENEQPITKLTEWGKRRQGILKGMSLAMGPVPDTTRRVPLNVRVLESREEDSYTMQRIRFTPEPDDEVPAWLMIPKKAQQPCPAMLCLHQTIPIGKDEPAGLGGSANLHYAQELAERGFVCLVPDYPSFGEYAYDFPAHKDHYDSGSMKAIWNNIRAIDLLESLPQVDPDRIGCMGHSLGGHNTLFTAAFDQRLRAVVTSCGFTAFHHYYDGNLAGWTSDRYMPRIRDEYGNDPNRVPFDFYEVLGAIAPRAIFVNAPLRDSNFEVGGVRKVEAEIGKIYALYETKDRLRFEYPDCEHDFPPAVREAAYKWLEDQLK